MAAYLLCYNYVNTLNIYFVNNLKKIFVVFLLFDVNCLQDLVTFSQFSHLVMPLYTFYTGYKVSIYRPLILFKFVYTSK